MFCYSEQVIMIIMLQIDASFKLMSPLQGAVHRHTSTTSRFECCSF